MSQCPVWLFEADPRKAPCDSLAGPGIQVLPLAVPDTVRGYCFADKVYACARAEELATSGVRSLMWLNAECLIVQPPLLLELVAPFVAAVRPVHIRNVGIPATGPVDDYWRRIYQVVGVSDAGFSIESFVDRQQLRAYFNTHAFSFDPSIGLCRRWFQHLAALVGDGGFQAGACSDELHQVFLHQAVLSTLLAASPDAHRIRALPPGYSYPYNLQSRVPQERRAQALNDLVCVVYEERPLDPAAIEDIVVREPLRSWLSARVGSSHG